MICIPELTDEADEDLNEFNKAEKARIIKQINKFAQNPLPKNEGGHGNPLGNKHGRNLTGYCKITLKKMGVRVVYKVVREDKIMKVIVIAARADEEVYDIAAKRAAERKS
jgi:mRNA interferase RelE/StbE